MNAKKYWLSWGAFLIAFAIIITTVSLVNIDNLIGRIIGGLICFGCLITMILGFYHGLSVIAEAKIWREN